MDPNNPIVSFLPLIAIMAIMYFLMIRPQQKREQERKAKINAIQKGDEVLTVGGIYGKVTQIDETSILAQVDTNTKLRIDKNAIQTVVGKDGAKATKDSTKAN